MDSVPGRIMKVLKALALCLALPGAASSWALCTVDADCEEGQYCRKDPGDCGGTGTCTRLRCFMSMLWAWQLIRRGTRILSPERH